MEFLGIQLDVKNSPKYQPDFIPMAKFNAAFLAQAREPIAICVERNAGLRAVCDTFITGTNREADRYYIERMVKYLLWAKGGYKVTVCGCPEIGAYIARAFSATGKYAFDNVTMARVYEKPFEVICTSLDEKPAQNEQAKPVGGKTGGCRIGFDAGGSDRKVSAVIDGEAIFSEEVVWHPKVTADPQYHFDGIVSAMKTAASKMPRVDSIGVSSAGIYIDNRTMIASLFLKVSPEDFEAKVKDIYIRAAAEIGPDIPLSVVNDGDVTALAGAMEFGDNNVLGIAMGTSEAGGYIDENGLIKGWLNELAFCPADASPEAMRDEWSGDIGCGVKYFSQDSVIKLALNAGIALDTTRPPGENLKIIQDIFLSNPKRAQSPDKNDEVRSPDKNGKARFPDKKGEPQSPDKSEELQSPDKNEETRSPEKVNEAQTLYKGSEPLIDVARGIFESIGVYLGHTLPYYHDLYRFKHVLLLGRVMSGEGGNLILATARRVIAEEYPTYQFNMHTPDEKARRVGQSVAAATL